MKWLNFSTLICTVYINSIAGL